MKKTLLAFGVSLLLFGCFKKDEPVDVPEDDGVEVTVPTTKPAVEKPKPVERVISNEPTKEAPKPKVRKQDFDISADEKGLIIKSFRGKRIDKVVSENPVQNISFDDEFLIFDEQQGQIWVSKTINLSAYAEYLTQD